MTERERLAEMIKSAMYWGYTTPSEIAERLIEDGDVIVTPCKVGTEIFFVGFDNEKDGTVRYHIDTGKIASFSYDGEYLWAYARYDSGLTFWHKQDSFGINTFFAREEAEAALAERRETCVK